MTIAGAGNNTSVALAIEHQPYSSVVALNWLLRLSLLLCFVGHGAFGLMTKAEWLPFFRVVGLSDFTSWYLMPLIGAMDITLGVACFLWPMRALLWWAAFWCVLTALMRPLAGMSWFEFFERAGNYGVPIVLLLSNHSPKAALPGFFAKLRTANLSTTVTKRLIYIVLAFTSLLLLGHGGFGLVLAKASLAKHYEAIGWQEIGGYSIVRVVGAIEIAAGFLVLLFPTRIFLLSISGWKLATEALYPVSGAPVWETVERAGSYILPVAGVVLYKILKEAEADAILTATATPRS